MRKIATGKISFDLRGSLGWKERARLPSFLREEKGYECLLFLLKLSWKSLGMALLIGSCFFLFFSILSMWKGKEEEGSSFKMWYSLLARMFMMRKDLEKWNCLHFSCYWTNRGRRRMGEICACTACLFSSIFLPRGVWWLDKIRQDFRGGEGEKGGENDLLILSRALSLFLDCRNSVIWLGGSWCKWFGPRKIKRRKCAPPRSLDSCLLDGWPVGCFLLWGPSGSLWWGTASRWWSSFSRTKRQGVKKQGEFSPLLDSEQDMIFFFFPLSWL